MDEEEYEDFETETEEENPVEDMLASALEGDYVAANKSLGDILGDRISDALDAERIRISDEVYNGVEYAEEPEIQDLSNEDIEFLEDLPDDEETD